MPYGNTMQGLGKAARRAAGKKGKARGRWLNGGRV